MDHESLRTASTYLNNLLLARGLLRNGEPVDFVKPSKESRAQIINLVHDLILREDRDREQRERIAVNLRALQAEDVRKTTEIEKLKVKCEEAARDGVQARTAERVAKEECKKIERAMKSLHEQAGRLKASLAQVKTQCVNDIRKRDLELARLKAHLQGQQRGNKVAAVAPSMTMVGGAKSAPAFDASVHDLADPAYSLKQETTEFLTQLSQSLSDENDSLISLIRGALETLRELLALPNPALTHPDSAIGSMGSDQGGRPESNGMLHALPTSYETLASDMQSTLCKLKAILNNPSFVNVEEVEVRDEEIVRLREGWERMERRWKEVLTMMEGWRQRVDTGDTINIDDLRRGMGLVSPGRQQSSTVAVDADNSLIDGDSVSEIRLPDITEESIDVPIAKSSVLLDGTSPKRKRDVLEPPASFDLRPSQERSARRYVQRSPVAPIANFADSEDVTDGDVQAMTVEEKLRFAQREAEEAAAARAVTGTGTHTRSNGKTAARTHGLDGAADEELDDTLGKLAASPMAKKTKIKGRPRRRKSTLNPEELEALLVSAEN